MFILASCFFSFFTYVYLFFYSFTMVYVYILSVNDFIVLIFYKLYLPVTIVAYLLYM